jgi:exopolysaccharide biosynthesis polyprenyl glycosylphosphotransferase
VTETTTAPEAPPKSGTAAPPQRRRSDPLRRRLLVLADTLAVGAVCLVVGIMAAPDVGAWALVSLPLWLLFAKLHGLYDRDHRNLRHLTVDETTKILSWSVTGTAAMLVLLYLCPTGAPGYVYALAFVSTGAFSAFVLRVAARALWRHFTPPERALIVGAGPLAEMTRRKLLLFTDMHVVAAAARARLSADEVREGPQWLDAVDRVLLAASPIDEDLVAELVRACRPRGIKLSLVPPAGAFGTAVELSRVAELPVVEYNTWDISRSTILLKRSLDIAVAGAALTLLAPLAAVTAAAIYLDTRSSPIFVQRRAGLFGRPFRMLKFRTMVADAEERLDEVVSLDDLEEPMFKLQRDPRVTRIGAFLRRTSLDELPQLVNVLRGEMSLVGPRPEQLDLVERYGPEHRFRLAVKPGLTGPMQVFGRGELSFEERLAVERDYIENLSLGRDLRILAMTLAAVAGGRGAY